MAYRVTIKGFERILYTMHTIDNFQMIKALHTIFGLFYINLELDSSSIINDLYISRSLLHILCITLVLAQSID